MLAEVALENAENDLIGLTTQHGLIVIYDTAAKRRQDVRLYFIAGDKWGFDLRRMILAGVYKDLGAAVTSASLQHNISETAWMPLEDLAAVSVERLLEAIKKYETDKK